MRRGQIDYGRLVEIALRSVVRDVLKRLGEDDLPPPHHFYVTFRTADPGVDIPEFLRERYPSEMTIVLQHQFWDLVVDEDGFAVTLSFNDAPQRLRVPYSALKVFADPGAEFGLQFTLEPDVVPLPTAGGPHERRGDAPDERHEAEIAELPPQDERAAPDAGAGAGAGAEVVSLDTFRRK
ncbi:SspB family protein [Marinimicrococcus flavescens]|uniref:ClpXP protease specificity-enhancing factor SspB n=1 Tax=Marinimicrococcus flavescens TaxID=3031815 RepID=A0AAP3UXK0_9PROT|nr:ClpXP protease specificity-enhancing factor SspB [Marinimicrococcus flavescens]